MVKCSHLNCCCQHSSEEISTCQQVRDHISKLVPQGETLQYKKGQVLFYEGHMPYGFYLVTRGNVTFPHETTPKGQTIGLCHLIKETPYCSTCTAKTDVEVLFFPKTLVHDLIEESKS